MEIRKTGKAKAAILALGTLVLSAIAHADAKFFATVDRNQITVDESIALKLSVESDGRASVEGVAFDAPQFDLVNEYSSTQAQSYYDGTTGRFGMKTTQEVVKVLRPRKAGTLRISGLKAELGGKRVSSPDIEIQVLASGAATPPPRGYGGSGVGLRGAGKRTTSAPLVKIRVEVDKSRIYKGEQLVVSYYLYRRVRVFNISVDKFPVLNGFLREDLEMPVLGQRLDSERVLLDGVAFDRSLLMKYAAYPLQDGTLKIDSAGLKYAYYPNTSSMDNEDPFAGFFQQMTPAQGSDRSDPVQVEVVALPEDGRPQSFTGGVGDFNVAAALDKTEVRANEAVTLTVKLEGRGNVAAIGEPKMKLPENVELYDSKGTAKAGRLGVGQKVFEFLMIPRVPGAITLPSIEFSFYDPAKKQYVKKLTDPFVIQVGDPAPGTALIRPGSSSSGATAQSALGTTGDSKKPVLSGLKAPEPDGLGFGIPVWRWLFWLAILLLAGLAGWVILDLAQRTRKSARAQASLRDRAHSRSWEKLLSDAERAHSLPWGEVIEAYERLAALTFDALDEAYALNARSRPRSELGRMIIEEKGLAAPVWKQISDLLERAEMVRFAVSAGVVSEQIARTELRQWVEQGQNFAAGKLK